MTAEEFERQVIAGEITDFEPYLKETGKIKEDLRNKTYRLILLQHGIEIERILELDGAFAISTCIQEGLLPERYDAWKDRNEEWILETFAENGYYLDELIESEYDDVREIVIENELEIQVVDYNPSMTSREVFELADRGILWEVYRGVQYFTRKEPVKNDLENFAFLYEFSKTLTK